MADLCLCIHGQSNATQSKAYSGAYLGNTISNVYAWNDTTFTFDAYVVPSQITFDTGFAIDWSLYSGGSDRLYIIYGAVGGSPIGLHIKPGLCWATQYGFIKKAQYWFNANSRNPKFIIGWWQGEAEAVSGGATVAAHAGQFATVLSQANSYFGSSTPFYACKIQNNGADFVTVNNNLAAATAVIETNDQPFSDAYHVTADGAIVVGQRMAAAWNSGGKLGVLAPKRAPQSQLTIGAIATFSGN